MEEEAKEAKAREPDVSRFAKRVGKIAVGLAMGAALSADWALYGEKSVLEAAIFPALQAVCAPLEALPEGAWRALLLAGFPAWAYALWKAAVTKGAKPWVKLSAWGPFILLWSGVKLALGVGAFSALKWSLGFVLLAAAALACFGISMF